MNESDIVGSYNIVRVTNIVVNTGGPAIITCRNIPVSEARTALDQLAKWSAGARGSLDPFALDVTGTDGQRTVIPFERIVMLRAADESRR